MKMYVVLILSILAIAISGCSGSENDASSKTVETATPQAQTPAKTATAPAAAPGQAPSTGKVVKAMHAGGYTYMEIENKGKQFWVAAPMMNVKRNDHVAWSDGAVMKKFTSSSLRRTFEEIIFVSAAKVM